MLMVDYHLHEYLLALWGCPLGEMVDLERLSEMCKEKKRWTFFVTSAPANVPGKSDLPKVTGIVLMLLNRIGGVGSHVNGTAIF